MSVSNQHKAVVHVAKHQLNMADEDYRALLRRAGGVGSSAELDEAGFTAVMAEMERLGFRRAKGRAQQADREGFATRRQLGKIYSLWSGWLGRDDESALCHWLQEHLGVSHPRFLMSDRAGKTIAILLKMNQHKNAKRPIGSTRRSEVTPSPSSTGAQQ